MHIHKSDINVDLSKQSPVDQIKTAFSILSKEAVDENGISGGTAIEYAKLMVRFASSDHLAGAHTAEFAQMNIRLDNPADFKDNRYFVSTQELQDLYQTSGFNWTLADYAIIYASIQGKYAVQSAAISSNVATITTLKKHGFAEGHTVVVSGVGASFNGSYTITSVNNQYSFSYAKTASNTTVGAVGNVASKTANYYVALDAMRFENIANISSVYGLVGYSEVSTNYEGYARAISKKQNTSNFIEFRYALDVE
jgi:hypothetical protein